MLSIGEKVIFTLFGESHSEKIGIKICGMEKGIPFSDRELSDFLKRRMPKDEYGGTQRRESDKCILSSGIEDGKTNGKDIIIYSENKDIIKDDYEKNKNLLRPGHADYISYIKYGEIKSGGGVFSGRMTLPICMGGYLAISALKMRGIEIESRLISVCGKETDEEIKAEIAKAALEGDSLGGICEVTVKGLKAGIGEPLFDSLKSKLAGAIAALPAIRGIEFGSGFKSAYMKGSENNDPFIVRNGNISALSNNHGGLLGGISSGMPIVIRVAVKPTPTIRKEQKTVDIKNMVPCTIKSEGRHDICIAPRILPALESVCAMVILNETADNSLYSERCKIDEIDDEIARLFDKRIEICRNIATIKKKNGSAVLDKKREEEILDSFSGSKNEAQKKLLFEKIIELSRKTEEEE